MMDLIVVIDGILIVFDVVVLGVKKMVVVGMKVVNVKFVFIVIVDVVYGVGNGLELID